MELAQTIYWEGASYIWPVLTILFVVFSLYRYKLAMRHYIETGDIERADYSWFFTDRWLFAPDEIDEYRKNDYFCNNPFVVTMDIFFAAAIFLGITLAWPVSLTVGGILAYARYARIRYLKKKEFVDRLAGTYEGP